MQQNNSKRGREEQTPPLLKQRRLIPEDRFLRRRLGTLIPAARRVSGGAIAEAPIHGTGEVRILLDDLPEKSTLCAGGSVPGSKGAQVPFQRDGNSIAVRVTPTESLRTIWIAPAR